MSASGVAKPLLYLSVASQYWFACYYDWNYVNIPPDVHRMGIDFGNTKKLKFLTYWNALLQAFFFTIAFLNEIIGSSESAPARPPLIRKLKDVLLPSLAFPMSMFVGLTFWGLYVIDRELVFPRAIDAFFPQWLNHVMHTNIMIFMLIEMYTSFRRYPPRTVGAGILSVFMLCYLVWIHVIFFKTGVWVYPVLDVLNFPAKIAFFGGLLGLSLLLYFVGEKLNQRIWLSRVTFDDGKRK